MTRIFTIIPVKNEQHRYLESCIADLKHEVDEIFVWDDGSSDDSVSIAEEAGALVARREKDAPSFMENESEFRADMWKAFSNLTDVTEEDWVLALDADEFLAGPFVYQTLLRLTEKDITYAFKFLEIFEISNDKAFKRTDGYWDRIFNPRFFRFKNDLKWPNGKMGCGSVPSYALKQQIEVVRDIRIMHLGYTSKKDRKEKYQRYIKKPGHNLDHIKSILTTPDLQEVFWNLPYDLKGKMLDV